MDIYYQFRINTLKDKYQLWGLPVWLLKQSALVVGLFGIFVLSGKLATWVFTLTSCLWTSSALFGVIMLGAGTIIYVMSIWDMVSQLLS